jgi:ubiquinone/menaquinone biosynthesis C-methylase UbiE
VDTAPFWAERQPGFAFTDAEPGTERFYADVERHRYTLEPHIREVVRFHEWARGDVLEVGCGVGTDGAQFAKAGARYVGVDQTDVAVELARRRFEIDGLAGTFEVADATRLPFPDQQFDLVFSHGVIHHIPDTDAAVREFFRVLRPGGVALVMVYHRASLNYRFNILAIRRLLAAMLLMPTVRRFLTRVASGQRDLVEGHVELLREHGLRYLTDKQLFLSNNTDGPHNPLSKVYDTGEAHRLFAAAGFDSPDFEKRYLNLRLYPRGDRLARTRLARRLEHRIGWHLYVRAAKQAPLTWREDEG